MKNRPPKDSEIEWPGYPGDKSQGAIWKDIVHPRIRWCDRLLAFVDLPNANVAFELGYALRLEKQAALARVRAHLPVWLCKPPLDGFICAKADTPDGIRALIDNATWVNLLKPPALGDGVLLLCPHRSGAWLLEEIGPAWSWRQIEKEGWDLHDVPEIFSDIGRVVWIIAAHDEGPEGRDREENATLAILAGYAHARQLPVDIFQQTDTRVVADVISRRQPFSSHDRLVPLLKAIADEQQRIIAAKTAPVVSGALAITLRHKLRAFLCHSSHDKMAVRKLYQQLIRDDFSAWFDEEDLLPGQEWETEIRKAVRASDVVVVCLSRSSITKEGYVQKEIRYALDVAAEKPPGIIFLIPARLDECEVPEGLKGWQWVDLYKDKGFERLLKALRNRGRSGSE